MFLTGWQCGPWCHRRVPLLVEFLKITWIIHHFILNVNHIYLAVWAVALLPTVTLAHISKQTYLSPLGSVCANKVAAACILDLFWWQTHPKLTKNGSIASELSQKEKTWTLLELPPNVFKGYSNSVLGWVSKAHTHTAVFFHGDFDVTF